MVAAFGWVNLLVGLVVAFISAALAVKLFVGLLTRLGLVPFAIYRVVLGVALLVLFGGGSFLQWFPLRGLTSDNWSELTMIGNLFSLMSVGGIGGDAARIVLLIRDHPGRKLVITMAVLVDHLAGMVTMAALFFIISAARFEVLADQSALGRGVIRFAWFYLGGGLAVVALFFLCASPPIHRRIHGSDRFARWPVLRRIPEIYDVYRSNWKHTLAGVMVSFVMLFAYFISFWCGLKAVGGTASVGTVITAMPVIDAISGLPVSVAGLGVREKLFEILMNDLAGVPASTAVAASLAGFACNLLWAVCVALFFLKKRDRLQIAELQEANSSARE
jgi:uncharacterized membrane protein YbhN (UPF0104 family)